MIENHTKDLTLVLPISVKWGGRSTVKDIKRIIIIRDKRSGQPIGLNKL